MRSRWALLLGVVLCVLALPACGPSDEAVDEAVDEGVDARSTEPGPTTGTPEVVSISVVQLDGRGAGTVWTLDRPLDLERPGAEAAFAAAASPAVRARAGRAGPSDAPRQVPSFRVVVVWEDGERSESVGGPAMLGPVMTAVVVATRKAAEPVRG